jgi:hypothetical protein
VAKNQCASAEKHSRGELTHKAAPRLHATCCCGLSEPRRELQYYSTAPAHQAGQNLQNAAFSIKTKLQPIQNNEVVELATTAFFEWRACAGAYHADNALPGMGLPVWRKSSSRREWWTSFRLEDGSLVEHWDLIQDKAARETSKTGLPTFGDKSPE